MKRLCICLLFVLLLCSLPVTARATEAETSVSVQAVVSSGGSCQVSIMATVYKTQTGALSFPVPRNASSIALNGKSVRTQKTDTARLIDLSDLYGSLTGKFTFTIHYTLKNVVYTTRLGLELRLPLLSGFSLGIDKFDFHLTLPGEISEKPAFTSGYHQSNIEKDLSYKTEGVTLSGTTLKALKDHETLLLTLPVTEAMFPQPILKIFTSDIDSIGISLCAALALLYWLWKLRCLPPRRKNCTTPPDGYSAGQLCTILSLQNANLSLMVFSWAQLGYLTIRPKKNKVLLQKRMNMGNERSDYEKRCFDRLFAKGETVDCSGYRYALQCQKVSHSAADLQPLVDRRCGNRTIFRALTTLCGLFAGIGMGLSLGFGGFLQPLFAVLFALFGAYAALHIQNWAACLFLYNRQQLAVSTLFSVLWIALSYFAGRLIWGLLFIGLEFLAGLLAYYGGRRTEFGRQAMAQTLGFRQYLRSVPRETLDAISKRNPDYFFDMAPYAVALGVGKSFAHQFGAKPFRECPYLEVPLKETITAACWNQIMEQTLDKMEAHNRQVPFREFSRRVKRMVK